MRFEFFVFLFCALMFSPAFAANPSGPVNASKPKVIIQNIKSTTDLRRFLYPARVEPKVNSVVTAETEGHVRKILKTLGSPVRAGEIVLYLENRDPAFTYSAIAVRAPVSGVVSLLAIQLMGHVGKGDKLFAVMNVDSLRVSAEVPAAEVSTLQLGARGEFQMDFNSNLKYPIRLVGLSPIVDPRTGTATAEIEFFKDPKMSSRNKMVIPPAGSVGQVSFETTSGQIIMVPESAIGYVEGKPTVKVLDNENRSRRQIIELGEQREALFVVKTGLKSGDRMVVRANRNVKDGEEIEIETSEKKENL